MRQIDQTTVSNAGLTGGNLRMQSEHAISVGSSEARTGFASGSTELVAHPRKSGFFHARYLAGELSGLTFVAATAMYNLVVPASMSRSGAVTAWINRTMKRSIDILGAVVGLLLTAPFFILVPLAIRLESPGPIFYSQLRVGLNRRKGDRRFYAKVGVDDRRARDRRREDIMGMPFQVIKFRTMMHNAEKYSGPVWASKDDPRITKVGKFLRKSRLDEIPQFINVLKGEMSLVGPRPERPHFVRDLSEKVKNYERRLSVKPGLTGLAQVENGYDSSLASVMEKLRYDLYYIRTWSIWSDIRIMIKTVGVVLTGKGAH